MANKGTQKPENPEVIAIPGGRECLQRILSLTWMKGMKHTEQFQKDLFDEIVGRIKQDDESVPYKENGYFYYTRYEEGKEYPIFCRREGTMEAQEEILANVNEMAEGYSYYQVGGLSVSPNNRYMALGIDTVSRRKYTIYIKDLETGKMLEDRIPLTTGGASWASDNLTLFYTQKDDETLRSKAIFQAFYGKRCIGRCAGLRGNG